MLTALDAVADLDASKPAFAKAGGTQHSDEDERDQLYKILPAEIPQDMLSHAYDQPTAAKLVSG